MLLELIDAPIVNALALEHAGSIMQAMGQNMGLGRLPGHQLAVIPEAAVALVEWDHFCHDNSLFFPSSCAFPPGLARRPREVLLIAAWRTQKPQDPKAFLWR